jgi:methanogenic corrinoid protein MtbC1
MSDSPQIENVPNVQIDQLSSDEKLYSPRAVAKAIGVSESSLKRWCDAGHVDAIKTAGGHRRMTPASVIQFLQGRKYSLARPQEIGLPNVNAVTIGDAEDAVRQLYDAATAVSEDRVREIIFHLFVNGWSIEDLFDRVVSPVFEKIGRQWDCGQIKVYQEREICTICLNVFRDLRSIVKAPPENGFLAIGASPSNDHYMLPTTAVEMTLQANGIRARSLGSNIPFESLLEASRAYRPRIMWISVSHVANLDQLVEGFNWFSNRVPAETLVVAGGSGLSQEIRSRIRNVVCCDNLSQLVTTARGIQTKTATTPSINPN